MIPTLAIYGIHDRLEGSPFHVHDHNLCLMQNGRVINYLQLERFTRSKYDNRLHDFIEEIIESKLIDLTDEFDLVNVNSFVGTCFISKNGRLRIESHKPETVGNNLMPASAYFQKDKTTGFSMNAYLLNHELAHIAANMPFYGEFRENSLLVHFDGGASLSNFSAFVYQNGQIQTIEYHWDLAEYTKFFNANALAFMMLNAKSSEHTSVPGKLMGFAAFGTYKPEIGEWMKTNGYFKDIWNKPELFIAAAKNDLNVEITEFPTHNKFLQDCAAVFQCEFQIAILNKIIDLQKQTKTDFLYYSGGAALNIITNTKIIESNAFKDVFIPPCCNDSGLSIGAAAFFEWKKHGKIEKHSAFLNNFGLQQSRYKKNENLIVATANLLLDGKIIGVANGFAECGPRALGNRSLLCLANSKELSEKLSMQIKKREWYRPVAPIMLEKNARYFTEQNEIHHLSKFMLLDFLIPEGKKKELEGAVHVNGTSRIQTVFERQDNEFIYDLLSYLDENHNIKALINTSFNAAGEPIVHTVEQAMLSAKKMGIDAVVINYQLINLTNEL